MIYFRKNEVFCIGDTHSIGAFHRVLDYIPKNSDIVHLGDLGVGFTYLTKDLVALENLNEKLKDNNCRAYIIRGNHDDPERWPFFLSNLCLVKDYERASFPDKTSAVFVGGGISIDRAVRIPGVSYWKDEITPQPPKNLGKKFVVFAHDCPSYINNSTEGLRQAFPFFVKNDPDLILDSASQRKTLDKVCDVCSPKFWIYGHFHKNRRQKKAGVEFQCLGICKIKSFHTKRGIESI